MFRQAAPHWRGWSASRVFRVYLEHSGDDLSLAERLYVWDQALSGAWHTHLGYVEVAVRNAIDRELRRWNHRQPKSDGSCCQESWTLEGETGERLYRMIRPKLIEARRLAANEADRRTKQHHRYNCPVAHEDVLAQLTFGAWVRMVNSDPQQHRQKHNSQRELWDEALHNAFPGSPPDEKGRDFIGKLLESLRRLRNRVAHHENLSNWIHARDSGIPLRS